MDPIITYIKDGNLPADPAEARKVKVRLSRFTILNDMLYKGGFSQPYLKCLDLEHTEYVLREIHEGVCGNDFGPRSLVRQVVHAGYFQPTMQKDAAQVVQRCNKCQRFENVQHVPAEHLTSITSPWPFSTWGIDIMGPLPLGKKQVKFLVVAIDYFTKQMKVEPLAVITEAKIQHFVWKNIVYRFGIPRVIISDNRWQFDSHKFRDFCKELGIRNHYSSPGHSQANGQTKVTNHTLVKLIKTQLEGAKEAWPNKLPEALWAYRMTMRTPTGEMPFMMAFGTQVEVPVEVEVLSLKMVCYDKQSNDEGLKLALDCLPEVKDYATQRMDLYQERMTRYYNQRVKLKRFNPGDMVLWKVSQATKDPNEGKLGPNQEGPYKVVRYSRGGSYYLEDTNGKPLPHPWNAALKSIINKGADSQP